MAKGYSARGGFSGGGSAMRQQQMQQKLLKMQQDMAAAQEAVENASFTAAEAPSITAGDRTPSLPFTTAAATAPAARTAQMMPMTMRYTPVDNLCVPPAAL